MNEEKKIVLVPFAVPEEMDSVTLKFALWKACRPTTELTGVVAQRVLPTTKKEGLTEIYLLGEELERAKAVIRGDLLPEIRIAGINLYPDSKLAIVWVVLFSGEAHPVVIPQLPEGTIRFILTGQS